MSTPAAQPANTFWIASYPKSGNTWLRLFLQTYVANPDKPMHINDLPSGSTAYLRKHFDELLGFESADFPPEMLTDLRPRCYDLAARNGDIRFVKTHEYFTRTSTGEPVFSAASSGGAIMIVRNPFDVAVSMSHFLRMTLDDTIARMSRQRENEHEVLTEVIPHETGSWSSFASSWLDGSLPLHVIRYEDMLDRPEDTFAGVLSFLKLPLDESRLEKAIAFTSFKELKQQETQSGFAAMQTGAKSFFRAGKKNNWQQHLSHAQQKQLQSDHSAMMKRFGYFV